MTKVFRTYSMVNATNIPFDICDQCMNPRENYSCILSRANNYRLMFAWTRIQNTVSRPTICKARNIFFKTIFEYLADTLSTKVFDLLHISKTWPMSTRFHSHYNLRFTRGPPTSLSRIWRAKVGID